MEQVKSYRDLIVWQKAMDLVALCYQMTQVFPDNQKYNLTSQLQRAAISVPANIAEGHGRQATGDYIHHLSIARGSLMELETHIQIARRLNYLEESTQARFLKLTEEIGRMLSSLAASLRTRRNSRP